MTYNSFAKCMDVTYYSSHRAHRGVKMQRNEENPKETKGEGIENVLIPIFFVEYKL